MADNLRKIVQSKKGIMKYDKKTIDEKRSQVRKVLHRFWHVDVFDKNGAKLKINGEEAYNNHSWNKNYDYDYHDDIDMSTLSIKDNLELFNKIVKENESYHDIRLVESSTSIYNEYYSFPEIVGIRKETDEEVIEKLDNNKLEEAKAKKIKEAKKIKTLKSKEEKEYRLYKKLQEKFGEKK